jgi:hypothetical protein
MRRNIKFPHFYCFLTRRVFSYLGGGLSGASVRSAAMAEASVMYVHWTSHSAARPAVIRRPVDLRLRNTAGAPKVTMPELMFLDSRGERLLARHTRAGSQEAWPGRTWNRVIITFRFKIGLFLLSAASLSVLDAFIPTSNAGEDVLTAG